MAMVNGVVDWAGENKFGGHSIRIDGNYYNSKFPIKCEAGDTVEFDNGSTGKYCNKLKVVSKGGGAASSSAVSSRPYKRGSFPIAVDDGQRSIIRQNALGRAVEVVALSPEGLNTRDEIIVEVIRVASELERFTAGDIDAEIQEEAKEKLTGS
jgi:hypothetical protein